MLKVEALRKVYTRGRLKRVPTFSLEADFSVDEPTIVGVLGPNGSGIVAAAVGYALGRRLA